MFIPNAANKKRGTFPEDFYLESNVAIHELLFLANKAPFTMALCSLK